MTAVRRGAALAWAALGAAVPLVLIANLVIELTPHARGLGFALPLRYAVVTPVCAIAALGAVALYRRLTARAGGPGTSRIDDPALPAPPARMRARHKLSVALAAAALVALVAMALFGPAGLVAAGAPAVIAAALALRWLAPRYAELERRRIGAAATVVFAALELAALGGALASERSAAVDLAADLPPGAFDVEHRFVDLAGGARVHYVDVGSGETLVFLHGNPAWSFQWRELIAGLRGQFRCVALDYPGFGWSSAPPGYGFTAAEQSRVVEALVDRLALHDVTLVMQDWGGPIGIDLAERRPELVRGVVLGNTWAWPTETMTARGLFSKIAGGAIGEFLQINFNGFARLGVSSSVVRPLPPAIADAYVQPFQALDRRGVAAFYPGQITGASAYFARLEAGLGKLADRPALIFWGMQDPGFPRRDLSRAEHAFPDHRTIELPDASHFFFEDAAPQVVAAIAAFMTHGSTAATAVSGGGQ